MAKSTTIVKVQTPPLDLQWVIIRGEGKADLSGNMKYQASGILDVDNNPEHKAFKVSVEDFWKANKPDGAKKAKSNGIYKEMVKTEQLDEDGDAIKAWTGKYIAAFNTVTVWPKDQKPNVIPVYNSKNKEVAGFDQKIGNGSVGRIGGTMDIYTTGGTPGVSLYLNGIKLLKLVEYVDGPGFADDDEEEGGYTGAEEGDWEEKEEASQPKVRL